LNILIISSGTTAICIFVDAIGAYAIARHRVGGSFLPIWTLSNRFLPLIVVYFHYFFFTNKYLGLIDTLSAQILANLVPNLPFAIWLLRGFIAEIPEELGDAAKVDGCGIFRLWQHIVFPLPSLYCCYQFICLLVYME